MDVNIVVMCVFVIELRVPVAHSQDSEQMGDFPVQNIYGLGSKKEENENKPSNNPIADKGIKVSKTLVKKDTEGGGEGNVPENNNKTENEKNDNHDNPSEEDKDEKPAQIDSFTFVAVLDIIFTDGCKRTCSGAIIHDFAVLTAGHCFTMQRDQYLQPELTLSFVIIGTRLMYETGYAQYLPIERILTHPRFKGWTADLALVFTFANMISDKPGKAVPLPSDKNAPPPVDPKYTVFSWGKCKSENKGPQIQPKKKKSGSKNSKVRKGSATVGPPDIVVEKRHATRSRPVGRTKGIGVADSPENDQDFHKGRHTMTAADDDRDNRDNDQDERTETKHLEPLRFSTGQTDGSGPLDSKSRYVNKHKSRSQKMSFKALSAENQNTKFQYLLSSILNEDDLFPTNARRMNPMNYNFSYYNNWRRQNGASFTNMTVGSFSHVNWNACKKVVENSLPPLYALKEKSEILCYSSEEFFITTEDSGAPVLHNGELIAITVGGATQDNERVAIGMKVGCFCEWILQMIPKVGTTIIKCCKECCSDDAKPSQKRTKKIYND